MKKSTTSATTPQTFQLHSLQDRRIILLIQLMWASWLHRCLSLHSFTLSLSMDTLTLSLGTMLGSRFTQSCTNSWRDTLQSSQQATDNFNSLFEKGKLKSLIEKILEILKTKHISLTLSHLILCRLCVKLKSKLRGKSLSIPFFFCKRIQSSTQIWKKKEKDYNRIKETTTFHVRVGVYFGCHLRSFFKSDHFSFLLCQLFKSVFIFSHIYFGSTKNYIHTRSVRFHF